MSLMFPMVNDASDLIAAKEVRNTVPWSCGNAASCRSRYPHGSYDRGPLTHCVLMNWPVCRFFSIGTNDLAQYTLAVDRNSDALSGRYTQHHPAVLKLIALSISAAHKHGIAVSVCGEMGSIPHYIPLLVGMGIDELSVHPKRVAFCKNIIRRCDSELTSILGTSERQDLAAVEQLINHDLKRYYQD